MNEFLLLLQFMWIPIVVTHLFSVTLPLIGTTLSVRNELMVSVTLPMLSGAVLAVLATMGIPANLIWLRVVITIIVVSLIYGFVMKSITSQAIRQTVLAGLWIGSEAVTRLLVTVNPQTGSEFSQLLNGEMLAVGTGELLAVSAVSAIMLFAFFRLFPSVRIYILDEMALLLHPKRFRYIDSLIKLFTTALIVLGTVTVGPLVTTALLIIPPLTADNRKSGLTPTLLYGVLIAVAASMISFPISLLKDLPPAYVISVGLIIVGIVVKLARR
jgi:ABC-type Mn2+/Zn2+ transport system permease subunit